MASVRRQINIAAAPRAVWRAFTTAEGIRSWWADDARIDPRPGGRIVLVSEANDERVEEHGILHTLRPTRRIEIAFDKANRSAAAGSRIAVHLARDGDETRVSIVHTGLGDDPEALELLDREWKGALLSLRQSLEE